MTTDVDAIAFWLRLVGHDILGSLRQRRRPSWIRDLDAADSRQAGRQRADGRVHRHGWCLNCDILIARYSNRRHSSNLQAKLTFSLNSISLAIRRTTSPRESVPRMQKRFSSRRADVIWRTPMHGRCDHDATFTRLRPITALAM